VKSHGVKEPMGDGKPEGRVVQIPPPLFFGFELSNPTRAHTRSVVRKACVNSRPRYLIFKFFLSDIFLNTNLVVCI